MAIYHLSAQVISRATGRSVVAAAAYRAGQELTDERTGLRYDYSHKPDVDYTTILAPPEAPSWVYDRQPLWNAVEAAEKRKDAQLARELQIALPRELTLAQQQDLLRDFVQREFVSHGMVADLAIHRDNPANPHAHVLLTTREITPAGFGAKQREWNRKALLLDWREAWAAHANHHLQRAGLEVHIDHRSYEAQGIALEPQRKIGIGREHREAVTERLEVIQRRVAEHQRIARDNGERLRANPTLALEALTHQHATFTAQDLARFLNTHTADAEQFVVVKAMVKASSELVRLGQDERGRERFTSQAMLEREQVLLTTAQGLHERPSHPVAQRYVAQARRERPLSPAQDAAFQHVLSAGDLKVLQGYAGSGKSYLLGAAREAWEAQGYTVKGAALAGIAAEHLELDAGIASRTLASYEHAWRQGRERLSAQDVLVIDEAGLLGTRQLARVLDEAQHAGTKMVLVGDSQQLQAIEAGAPLRAIAAQVGQVVLDDIRRQREPWQRAATLNLALGRPQAALRVYLEQGATTLLPTRTEAQESLLRAWKGHRHSTSSPTQLLLAFTRADVQALNDQARTLRRAQGELGPDHTLETARGRRAFAVGDQVMCLRNDRGLGVKNGTLGTIQRIQQGQLAITLDGPERRTVAFDSKDYPYLDHGYAATIHKAQGVTVDRAYVLATPHLDRHATYVALSRHREQVHLYASREDFPSEAALVKGLSRARPKAMALDYAARRGIEREIPVATAELHTSAAVPDPTQRGVQRPEPTVTPPTPTETERSVLQERYLQRGRALHAQLRARQAERDREALSARYGKPIELSRELTLTGHYRGVLTLQGVRYALVEQEKVCQLAPYDAALERFRDQAVRLTVERAAHDPHQRTLTGIEALRAPERQPDRTLTHERDWGLER